MAPGGQWRSVFSAQKTAITATTAAATQAMATTVPMTSLKRIQAPIASTMTARKRAPRDGLDSVSSMPPRIRAARRGTVPFLALVVRAGQVREARLRVARLGHALPSVLVGDALSGPRAPAGGGQRDHGLDGGGGGHGQDDRPRATATGPTFGPGISASRSPRRPRRGV